jgi:hypothetical protein
MTLDFYYIGGGALTTPFWAILNLGFGGIFFAWIITPIIYCTLS